jgi:hypothetical protein
MKSRNFRNGGAYVAVLALSSIVTAIAVGAIAVVRAQARANDALSDASEARQYALSGIELGRLWISQDPNWRSNRSNGVWASNQPIGNGTFTLEGTDPIDGNLGNRPHDPLVLKATGKKGQAVQILQVTLTASPVPLPALQYALHTGGQLHVLKDKQLTAGFATVSTNGSFRNDAVVVGSVEALSKTNLGTVTGTVTIPATGKDFPPPEVLELYALLGTEINPGNKIDKQILAPGYNPWGATNADGVYVIRPAGDFTLQNTRVNGTLVIVCPAGKTVTIAGQVFLQPIRADYPALIVYGDVDFQNTSASLLSEASASTNFNPTGAPYQGITDFDKADSYPSEIQGLVHVYGTTTFNGPCTIRGLLLCESAAAADAVACKDKPTIIYDSNLYTNPPQGYTSSVPMLVQQTSWLKVVN